MPTFGTDGVRGLANAELTPELALSLGRAAARVLGKGGFVVGRDTRRSGPMIQAALMAGLASQGADVADAGVLPTPGVAHLCAHRGLAGAVISASHNSFADNGVKLFGPGGTKLSEKAEAAVSAELGDLGVAAAEACEDPNRPTGPAVGWISSDADGVEHYRAHLLRALEGRRLTGVRVVLDCARGAASGLAASVFAGLGADVVGVLADNPDGTNINEDCGSTCPDALQQAVVERRADVGLAFDGDADRVVAVDERGGLVDGDQLLALFAPDLRARGQLLGGAVVVTVMANLGLHQAMAAQGIGVREVAVGDRNVLVGLEEGDLALGGEQSGHIIFRERATTGDGILTGLLLADLVSRRGRPLSELAGEAMTRLPQELVNVRVGDPGQLAGAEQVWAAVAAAGSSLGRSGRVVVRASGTEPLVRVMVEAPTREQAVELSTQLAAVVGRELGAAGSNRRS
ncbi:MAG: phosphoglucosamine mutase [Acidimicrobiales bacterium]|nr:MAG: phosphoglucosamine mutase [Acidimicrobiales bacterium]